MPACFEIDADGERVMKIVGCFTGKEIIILPCDGHTVGDLDPSAGSDGKDIVLVFGCFDQVAVDVCRHELKRHAGPEFPGNHQLVKIFHPRRKVIGPFGVLPLQGSDGHIGIICHGDRHVSRASTLPEEFGLDGTVIGFSHRASSHADRQPVGDAIFKSEPDIGLVEAKPFIPARVDRAKMMGYDKIKRPFRRELYGLPVDNP